MLHPATLLVLCAAIGAPVVQNATAGAPPTEVTITHRTLTIWTASKQVPSDKDILFVLPELLPKGANNFVSFTQLKELTPAASKRREEQIKLIKERAELARAKVVEYDLAAMGKTKPYQELFKLKAKEAAGPMIALASQGWVFLSVTYTFSTPVHGVTGTGSHLHPLSDMGGWEQVDMFLSWAYEPALPDGYVYAKPKVASSKSGHTEEATPKTPDGRLIPAQPAPLAQHPPGAKANASPATASPPEGRGQQEVK